MPNLNHSGPEGLGPKTGRIIGGCHKTVDEMKQAGEFGKGLGKRRHSINPDGLGKGKRIKYYHTFINNGEYHENCSSSYKYQQNR